MHLDPDPGSVAAAFVGLATTTSVAFPSVTIVAVIATIIGIIIIIIIIIAVAIELVLHRLPAVPADA